MRIPVAKPALIGNERDYILECVDTEWISSNGKFISRFEEAFANYIDVKHALTCCNGTVALHLPLLAMGIGPGDEVIVPTLTYIASANAVKYVNAEVVLADCDPSTWTITAADIEKKITPRTKAVIVVHLYGHPVDMEPIMALSRKHGFYVIEDCAESLGATYNNRQTGSIGHVGTYSFFGNKTITTGEGGMITTNDDALAEKMRLLKGQGMDPKRRYWHPVIGYNYRMTNIQAAIGLAQLEKIEWHLTQRRRIASEYKRLIAEMKLPVQYQDETSSCGHSYWMFTILLNENLSHMRDDIMKDMDAAGVETRPVFYNMHVMPPYKSEEKFATSESISRRGINFPTFSQLSNSDIAKVIETFSSVLASRT